MPTAPTTAPIHAAAPSLDPVPGVLTALLDTVATTEPDAPTWTVLAHRARALTAQLALTGVLPAALVVAVDDPPVVIARALQVAARTTAAPGADLAVRSA